MNDLIGRTIATRYFVASFLGKGGMAEVYKVWDKSRMANLAIKILNPRLAGNLVFLDHFRSEASTLAGLQHPNIVRFYSLERDGDIAFIVMDFVEGSTLREEISTNGIVSSQQILQIMRDVCAALNYAHEMGYVHCDIKPANIMINKNGAALVSDFGIARLAGGASDSIVRGGTPSYMSPEQIQGGLSTPASDIYALGVLLFEMLTGARPFTGQSAQIEASTADRVRWEQINLSPPSPRKCNPSISADLERIILRCLEKDPTRRYSSVRHLLSALEGSLLRKENRKQEDSSPRVIVGDQLQEPSGTIGVDKLVRSRKILAWLIISAGVLILFFAATLGSGGSANNISLPAPSISVRAYIPALDSNLKCVWCDMDELEWPKVPGHYYWETDFPANTPVLAAFGWCAIDQPTLDSNWRQIEYDLIIDDITVDDSKFKDIPVTEGSLFCYERVGVLEGWPIGEHKYIEIQRVKQRLFDGTDTYEAGEYIFEFTVNVR